MNVCSVGEAAGKRGFSAKFRRTVFEEQHSLFLFLQQENAQWSLLCIGWGMAARGGRIHAEDVPLSA